MIVCGFWVYFSIVIGRIVFMSVVIGAMVILVILIQCDEGFYLISGVLIVSFLNLKVIDGIVFYFIIPG